MDQAVAGSTGQVVIPINNNSALFGASRAVENQIQEAIDYMASKGYRLQDARGAKLRKFGHLIFEPDDPRAEGLCIWEAGRCGLGTRSERRGIATSGEAPPA
jgi:hypothetical protein